ncbi:adenylate/guanylate cyclase domain-containing protein [Alteromonas sp. H39]|uniref:adenylate/guanylate cyclase domain-containing protein n=1 Tax=Alteromonas sp. H39 TaxID=3389876 RepID=UPI0039E1C9E6
MNTAPALTGSEKHLLTQLHQTSRLLLACLALQLPFGLWHVLQGPSFALLNILIHIAVILMVVKLCTRQQFYTARQWMLAGFMSFVTLATVIWQQPGIPYFLLLGAVTCGFFFRRKEVKSQRMWAAAFALMFIVLNLQGFTTSSGLELAVHVSNTITLACASLLILYTLDIHSKRRWLHLLASQRQMHERLQQLLPPVACSPAQRTSAGETFPIDSCAVLFADMAGYKSLTTTLDDEDIVCVLNALYQRFDQRAQLMGICRIKTNGDEYMAALSGAFTACENPHCDVAEDMLCYARQISQDFHQVASEFSIGVELRIGIALGPVRGGMIGLQRPAFDIWGRTVNLASLLEQLSPPGLITACPQFYEALSASKSQVTGVRGVALPDGPGYALQFTT